MRINHEALRVIRERSGFKISRLAQLVEVTPAHLSNIEAGRRQASPELAAALAKALDVPLYALITSHGPDEAVA